MFLKSIMRVRSIMNTMARIVGLAYHARVLK